MRIKRPPPQRPTSPDHDSPVNDENSVKSSASFAPPPKLTLTNSLLEPTQSEPCMYV